MGPARHWELGGCTGTHLQGTGRKDRAWVLRIPSPRPRRPRPNKFLGRSLLRPLGALSALGTDSALHRASGRHPVPDLRPHPGGLAHVVCPVAARLASPRVVPSAALLRTLGPCNPHESPGISSPTPASPLPSPAAARAPSFGHSRLRARTPAWAHAAHARSCLPLARTHRQRSAWPRTLPPFAASTRCPLRRPGPGTQGSRAPRARRAPARRARSPGP